MFHCDFENTTCTIVHIFLFLKVIFNWYFNGKYYTMVELFGTYDVSSSIITSRRSCQRRWTSLKISFIPLPKLTWQQKQCTILICKKKLRNQLSMHGLTFYLWHSLQHHIGKYMSTTTGKFVDEYVMPSLPFDLSSTKNNSRFRC